MMEWKFWQNRNSSNAGVVQTPKLPKPKEIEEHMGFYLVVKEKLDPDWVWSLKYVKRTQDNNSHLYDFRIFNKKDADEKGIQVSNYHALDDHPNLILYHGYSDSRGHNFQIEQNVPPGEAA
jgi:hypothetical protein